MRLRAFLALLICSATLGAQGTSTAQADAAERSLKHGDMAAALRQAQVIVAAYEQNGGRQSAQNHIAAGRAYVILGLRSAAAVRQALSAFDAAIEVDRQNIEARLRTGDLFLDKYNSPEAKASFDDVLKIDQKNARATLGQAKVANFDGKRDAIVLARASVAVDPKLADARVFLAQLHLEAEAYDSAMAQARIAVQLDSESVAAWGVLGAAAMIRGDSAEFQRAKAAATLINPRPADFYLDLADAQVKQRRYGESVRLARQALSLDSLSVRALGMLGTSEMRGGNFDAARPLLEKAFAIDRFNLWHKNTLDLLDQMRTYSTVDRGRFRFVAPPKDASILIPYLSPLLETAFDSLQKRYQYTPPTPVRLEIYSRHADFSVRTVGLNGLGALGVSFGPVLAIDAPSARDRGEFNWGSTAWHELAHTFTLGLSNNRAPRWFSEGLSVLEERRARSEWGADATAQFLAVYLGGKIRPVSQLNDGFLRPRYSSEVIFSYYDASLVCEMIEKEQGSQAIVNMLKAYRDGLETPAVFARVLKVTPEQMDKHFDEWLRAKFTVPLAHIEANDGGGPLAGDFVNAMRLATEQLERNQVDSARATLLRAQTMFPGYAGPDSPALMLARMALDKSASPAMAMQTKQELQNALTQLRRVTEHNETAWDANLLEADIRLQLGDTVGALVPLQRLNWISPYDQGVHTRIAELATRTRNYPLAVRERRAILTLDPTDALEARYQLARALADAGDVSAARTELLSVLERAPSFEKAQALLLELRTRSASPPDDEEFA